jgi:hypothetical protein
MCVTLKNLTGRELTLYSLEGDRPLVTLTVDGPQPLTTSIFAPTGGEIEGIPTVRLADKVELNLDLAPQPSYRPQPAPARSRSSPCRTSLALPALLWGKHAMRQRTSQKQKSENQRGGGTALTAAPPAAMLPSCVRRTPRRRPRGGPAMKKDKRELEWGKSRREGQGAGQGRPASL